MTKRAARSDLFRLRYYIDKIERVLRKFLKYAAFILSIDHRPPHDYNPILNKLGLSSLIDRRKVANVKFLHLLIDGCIDSPVNL